MRRQLIQNAAKEVFLVKGLKSATMEDIANQAELSPSAIYSYFRTKEDLYASLNLITLEYLHKQVSDIYNDQNLSVEGKILEFKDAMYRTFKYDPIILKNIFRVQLEDSYSSLSPKTIGAINRLAHRVMCMFKDVYEEGVREGIFRPGHGMAHAEIMWSIFAGLVLWEEGKRKTKPDKDFLKPTLSRAFDVFLSGLKNNVSD